MEEYRRRVEARILALVESHPALQAIRRGEAVDDLQLLDLERTLQEELGKGDVELSPENIRRAYGLKVDSLLGFLRPMLELDALPGYAEIVTRQFEAFITRRPYNADQIRFLRAVSSVFLSRRRLEISDLYEPPLTNFGQDAVDRWFEPQEIASILAFTKSLEILGGE